MLMNMVRRDVATSLHEQLAQTLRAQIQAFSEGEAIPSELEMSRRFSLSRTTVRRAIRALVEEGLLVTRPGRGTFVAAPRVAYPLEGVTAFVEAFTNRGLKPESELLAFRWILDPTELAEGFMDGIEEALFATRRYRIEGKVCAFAHVYIPKQFGEIVTKAELEQHPSFQVIQEKSNVFIHHASITISSQVALGETALLLEVPDGAPVLVMQRWLYTLEDELVQLSTHFMPADDFVFRVSPTLAERHEVSYLFRQETSGLRLAAPNDETRSRT